MSHKEAQCQHRFSVGMNVPGSRITGTRIVKQDACRIIAHSPCVFEHRFLDVAGNAEADRSLQVQHGIPPAANIVPAAMGPKLILSVMITINSHMPMRQAILLWTESVEKISACQRLLLN